MSEKISEWLSLYNNEPKITLVEDMDISDMAVKTELTEIITRYETEINPLDVVLESTLNIITENLSTISVTDSNNVVMLNSELRNKAAHMILDVIEDKKNMKKLHDDWLHHLKLFLVDLYIDEGNINKEEVFYRVGEKYRLTGPSAIKAILSLNN